MRVALLILILLFVAACSLAITHQEQLGENEYELSVSGNGFSNEDDLLDKAHKRAEKLCDKDNYELDATFSKRWDWWLLPPVKKGHLEAKVQCLTQAAN